MTSTTKRNARSAGVLLYKRGADGGLLVLLAHPGGPFFARKDAGSWTIPKGEVEPGEDELACALREVEEETGVRLNVPDAADTTGDNDDKGASEPKGLLSLGEVRQRGGKRVVAWALEGDWAEGAPHSSNTFEMEWPPRSGRKQRFPEIDRLALFELAEARVKINDAQAAFLERLITLLQLPERAG